VPHLEPSFRPKSEREDCLYFQLGSGEQMRCPFVYKVKSEDVKMIRDTCARDPAHREQILRAEKTYGAEIKKGNLKPC
jgi:hypothetical protein